jgi:ABC-2 type transport system permease protein
MNTPSFPSAGAGAASDSPLRVGLWRTVWACEWRLLRGDAALWSAVLLLLMCTGYALLGGQQRLAARAAVVDAAKAEERTRLDGLAANIRALEQKVPKATGVAFVQNPMLMGRYGTAPNMELPAAPLAALAVGLADLHPPTFKVSLGSQQRFLFADEIANATQLAAGSFDVAFVAVYLLPLLLLALSYNVLSSEREQGTWALTQASSAPLAQVLMAKLTLRAGVLLGTLLIVLTAGLGSIGVPLADPATLTALLLTLLLLFVYSAFWLALALWVNSWRRDSSFNAVTLVVAWVLLVWVAPALINAVAQVRHPAPPRAEMVLALRQAEVAVDREAQQARYRAEHGQADDTAEQQRRTLELTLAADRRADEMLARHEAMVQAQRLLSDRLSLLAPPILVNDAIVELAGNGHTRWNAFLRDVRAFHQRWQAYFVGFAQRGAALTAADYAEFPRPQRLELPAWSGDSAIRVLSALAWVGVLALGCTVAALRRLAREPH